MIIYIFKCCTVSRIDDRRNGCFPCIVHKEWKNASTVLSDDGLTVNKIMEQAAKLLR